jgi:4-hydroxybenzoyl-CoA reductase beta subunit
MHLPKFEYIEAKTTKEACSFLSECKGQAKVLAGGTDLLVMMKQKVVNPKYLLNIKRIPGLDEINQDDNFLRIGALTTLANIESSYKIQQNFPMLSLAAGRVACQQIQTTATIGGNLCLDAKCWYYNQSDKWRRSRETCIKRGGSLCHVIKGGKRCYAVLSGDTISVLLALEAKVTIADSMGQRLIPVEEFYTGAGETPNILKPEEMVTEIKIPYLPAKAKGAFLKHSIRGALDFALADVSAIVTMEDSVCKDARIVISSIGPMVVRAIEAEETLKGRAITDKVLEEAGLAAVKGARLVSGIQSSVYYRRKIIHALTKRAIRQAAGIS